LPESGGRPSEAGGRAKAKKNIPVFISFIQLFKVGIGLHVNGYIYTGCAVKVETQVEMIEYWRTSSTGGC
jgi:hypothetical protein